MKDIGARLKEKREENGVSIEEAAEDLQVSISQLENIETGDMKPFKDIFYLKSFIRDYAKYLGLDYDKLVDEFNEFLFDYTSRIPVKEIEQAKKEQKEEVPKVISPYHHAKKKLTTKEIISCLIIILLIIAAITTIVILIS